MGCGSTERGGVDVCRRKMKLVSGFEYYCALQGRTVEYQQISTHNVV